MAAKAKLTINVPHVFLIEQYSETNFMGKSITASHTPCSVVDTEEEAVAIVARGGYVPSKLSQNGYMPMFRWNRVPKSKSEPIPKLEDLGLTNRTLNCLAVEGIKSTAALVRYSAHELVQGPNIGRKTIAEIEAALAQHKLGLRKEII